MSSSFKIVIEAALQTGKWRKLMVKFVAEKNNEDDCNKRGSKAVQLTQLAKRNFEIFAIKTWNIEEKMKDVVLIRIIC